MTTAAIIQLTTFGIELASKVLAARNQVPIEDQTDEEIIAGIESLRLRDPEELIEEGRRQVTGG